MQEGPGHDLLDWQDSRCFRPFSLAGSRGPAQSCCCLDLVQIIILFLVAILKLRSSVVVFFLVREAGEERLALSPVATPSLFSPTHSCRWICRWATISCIGLRLTDNRSGVSLGG